MSMQPNLSGIAPRCQIEATKQGRCLGGVGWGGAGRGGAGRGGGDSPALRSTICCRCFGFEALPQG